MAGYTYVVDAEANSVSGGTLLNTEIAVEQGQVVCLNVPADEMWSYQVDQSTNANGSTAPWTYNGFTANIGALVGSFDGGKTFFGVGTHAEITGVTNWESLSLGYWDSDDLGNSGSVTVTLALLTPETL